MKKTILCFGSGNEGDSLSWEICDSLRGEIQGTEFVKCENPFEIADYPEGKNLIILDVVKGIDRPKLFTSIKDFKKTKSVTAHDLDLGFFLKILENMKKTRPVIIGLPFGKKKNEVLDDIRTLISSV